MRWMFRYGYRAGELTDADRALLQSGNDTFSRVGELIEACRFKEALREVMSVAAEANRLGMPIVGHGLSVEEIVRSVNFGITS